MSSSMRRFNSGSTGGLSCFWFIAAEDNGGKLQIPSTKLQRSTNRHNPNTHRENWPSRRIDVCGLEFSWSLVFH
jgi:hypothetical protein